MNWDTSPTKVFIFKRREIFLKKIEYAWHFFLSPIVIKRKKLRKKIISVENKDFTVQELIQNQSFRRMVRGTAGTDEIREWDHWIEADARHREIAREAMVEIAGFEFSAPPQPDVDKEWKRLYDSTVGKSGLSSLKKYSTDSSASQWIYRVAAMIILGALIGLGIYAYSGSNNQASTQIAQITQQKTITTDDGEQKTIKFSNGSKIILNSNSAVKYTIASNQGSTINVLLEGEAYFDARDGSNHEGPVFNVETPDGVIKDIGTKFLVLVQRDRSRVVLQEGEVHVSTKSQKDAAQSVAMKAGQMLEFNKSKILEKKDVNSTFYTSWATGFMQFDQTTIKEFAGFVEQRFDVEVEVANPKFAGIKIDGGVYYRSLEELVRSVSKVAGIPVYQSADRDTVYIGNKN